MLLVTSQQARTAGDVGGERVGRWGFTNPEILLCFRRRECNTQTRGGFDFDHENMTTELLPKPVPSRLCSSPALVRGAAIPPGCPGRQRQQDAGGRVLPRWALTLACSSQPATRGT